MKSLMLCMIILLSCIFYPCRGIFLYKYSGGEITHKWLNDSTYKINFTIYTNCDLDYSSCILLGYRDTCGIITYATATTSFNSTLILPDGRPNGSSCLQPCANFHTRCDSIFSSGFEGYRIYTFESTFIMPDYCGNWQFAIAPPANSAYRRDTSCTNMEDNHWYYLETDINHSDTSIKNTSAELINPFPFYAPINQNFSYSLAATDIDGDSLVYHLSPPKFRSYSPIFTSLVPVQNIPFVPPFTMFEPFNTSGSFNWDSVHAIISFNAPVQQNVLLNLMIDEYRGGIWVGNSMRDIPIIILPVSNPLPQVTNLPSSWVNIHSIGVDSFTTCAGSAMSFCLLLNSTNPNAQLESSQTATAIPGVVMNYSNLYTDSVIACFNWTPLNSDTGWHTFTVTTRDTTCPIAGINTPQTFLISLYVYPEVVSTYLNQQTCSDFYWQGNTYTSSGSYVQTFTSSTNCDSVVTLNLSLNRINKNISQSGFSMWSNHPTGQYQWIDCKTLLPISGATNQGYSTLVGGDYAVVISDGICIDTSVCVTTFSLQTPEFVQSNIYVLYPNPAKNQFMIHKKRGSNLTLIKVYNVVGQLVKEIVVPALLDFYSVNVGEWSNGQYLLKFYENHQIVDIQRLSVTK